MIIFIKLKNKKKQKNHFLPLTPSPPQTHSHPTSIATTSTLHHHPSHHNCHQATSTAFYHEKIQTLGKPKPFSKKHPLGLKEQINPVDQSESQIELTGENCPAPPSSAFSRVTRILCGKKGARRL